MLTIRLDAGMERIWTRLTTSPTCTSQRELRLLQQRPWHARQSHPMRVPQVTFEITWDASKFYQHGWPSGAPNPYVWSFHESTSKGYGTHGDYLFGWKGDALQRAMDKSECFYDGCGSIKKQAMSVANKCTVKEMVGEQVDGL